MTQSRKELVLPAAPPKAGYELSRSRQQIGVNLYEFLVRSVC